MTVPADIIDPDDVEPARRRMVAIAARKIKGGSEYQLALFRRGYRLRSAGERAAAALSDLDKDQHPRVAHDEVDLAETAVKISFYKSQAAGFEK